MLIKNPATDCVPIVSGSMSKSVMRDFWKSRMSTPPVSATPPFSLSIGADGVLDSNTLARTPELMSPDAALLSFH